jgi:hypothetical protein
VTEVAGTPAYFSPQYEPPGLSIRATFLATDGSRPQEIILEWRQDPGRATLEFALDRIVLLAMPGDVHTSVHHNPSSMEQAAQQPVVPDPDETAVIRVCAAEGPGHDEEGHYCILPPGHDPVEPEGRQHRCGCGGIFATDAETPSVPGRRSRERRREGDR